MYRLSVGVKKSGVERWLFYCTRQQFLATQFLEYCWQLFHLPTQIRFPTREEHWKCHGAKLTNSLGRSRLLNICQKCLVSFVRQKHVAWNSAGISEFERHETRTNWLNFQCRVLKTVSVTTYCQASIRFVYTSLRTVSAQCVLCAHTKGLVPFHLLTTYLLVCADLNYTILTWAAESCVPMILSSDKLLNFTQVSSLKECLYEKNKKRNSNDWLRA